MALLLSGVFFVGRMDARIDANAESLHEYSSKLGDLDNRVRVVERSASPTGQSSTPSPGEMMTLQSAQVFVDGKLAPGYDMGVNTSGGRTGWVDVRDSVMYMDYPGGQSWGAVFITVGKPTDLNRPCVDVSQFRALRIELKGKNGGEAVDVGLKDNTDPDDGSETKITLGSLQQDWQVREIELSRFRTADLHKLYVMTEFVYAGTPQSVYVRKIEFIH